MNENNFYKKDWCCFYKYNESDSIWWTNPINSVGETCFSFDKKTVFSFFTDYPDKLTPEQIKIFKKENPYLAALKPTSDTDD